MDNKYARACAVGLLGLALIIASFCYVSSFIDEANEEYNSPPTPKPYDNDMVGVGALFLMAGAFLLTMVLMGLLAVLVAPLHKTTSKEAVSLSLIAGAVPIVIPSVYFWVSIIVGITGEMLRVGMLEESSAGWLVFFLLWNVAVLLIGLAVSAAAGWITWTLGSGAARVLKRA